MTEHHEVVVIGAGISGIAAAVQLRRAGVDDVLLLEKGDDVGGTWRVNTYPGCACDVPSRLYSFSFAPNPEWSRVYAGQAEILDYVREVARRHDLPEITRFGVEVESARWDDVTGRWQLTTSSGELTCRFLVSGAGPWNEPRIPDVPGLAEFPGPVFHSARWDHDVDLTGLRVAVVGTGASAVQFVPLIRTVTERVHLFQRTPHWVLPKADHPVPAVEKFVMRRVPGARRGVASLEYRLMETVGAAFHRPKPLMLGLQAVAKAHLRATVSDPDLRAKLTPEYLLGCKRILFSNDYYQALGQPDVDVHATAVTAVEGATVVGADGSRAEVDAIILGTGFRILDMPIAERVIDGDGRTLADHWSGSPEAHLGTVVAGFPNLFIVLGPSLGTGHTSAFHIAEAQVALIVKAVAAARRRDAIIEVRADVQAAYVADVQAALPRTAYAQSACNSYYVDANGRNSFTWPWSSSALTRRVSRFVPSDFHLTSRRKVSS